MAANTQLTQLLSAILRTPPWDDKTKQMTIPWQLFLQGLVTSNSGSSGNTVVTTNFGVSDFTNQADQQIADLQQQILNLQDNPALAMALQAVQVQQANNAVTTAGDVLDLIRMSEAGLILNSPSQYLAALPDSSANLDWFVSSNDVANNAVNANSQFGSSNSISEIKLMGPPDGVAVTSMDVQFMTIVNNDNFNCNVSLYYNVSGANTHVLNRLLLLPGYTLQWDENGFRVLNAQGVQLRY